MVYVAEAFKVEPNLNEERGWAMSMAKLLFANELLTDFHRSILHLIRIILMLKYKVDLNQLVVKNPSSGPLPEGVEEVD